MRKKITGSGFFINDLGYVVTNSHVVNGCDEINTILDDKKATSFIVINDVKNDLAVLKTGMEPESIASAAIQKRLGAKVVKIVYKGKGWSETDEPPEGMLF